MDVQTLAHAMGNVLPDDRYLELAPAFSAAMADAGCTTVERAAMWCAQLGHESLGLRYMEELADGSAYEGRADLGNTRAGDGVRFKGRGPIQVTGRANYTECSQWAYSRGLVSTPTFFVDHPVLLAQPQYGFVGAVWYWVAARPKLNSYADARDIVAATKAINGGTNGIDARTQRYQRCLSIGAALLDGAPAASSSTPGGDWFDMASRDDLIAAVREALHGGDLPVALRADVGFSADQIMTALGFDRTTAPSRLSPDQRDALAVARRDDVAYAMTQIGARVDDLQKALTAAAPAAPAGPAEPIDYDALARALLAHLAETHADQPTTAGPTEPEAPPTNI